MNKIRTQWHPAFCSAMRLELIDNQEDLQFTNEYNLNTKPIQVDLLVIKKSPDAVIHNEIGRIFRGHNIMEYKSPNAAMNIDTYYKSLSYAYLYKSGGDSVDAISVEDITISMVRERKPRELFRRLKSLGYSIKNKFPGIYYICRDGFPPTQIIVSSELTEDAHRWLTALTGNLGKERAERFVADVSAMSGKSGMRYADAVLSVVVKENRGLFETLKREVDDMCEELMKLMEPEIRQAKELAHASGLESGRREGLESGRREGLESGYRSLARLIDRELITEEQAAEQVEDREGFLRWRRANKRI